VARVFLSQSRSVVNAKPITFRHSNENRSMLCYVMLCHVMSCHVMSCHVMFVMLCYVMLCCVVLCCVVLCCVVLCCVVLCCVMLCYVEICYVMLCYVMLGVERSHFPPRKNRYQTANLEIKGNQQNNNRERGNFLFLKIICRINSKPMNKKDITKYIK